MAIKNYEKLVELLLQKMRTQAKQAGVDRAEVDVSGGIDSATVAALAVRAFGNDHVIGVYSGINSSAESRQRARLTAERFRFPLVELDLTDLYQQLVARTQQEFARLGLPFPDPQDPKYRTGFGGFRSCLRAPVGRFVNRVFGGGIREGTGNRDEDELIRFYQKGGDGEVDSNWIAGLFKGEVWELAKYLGVPDKVIAAKPSPDLWGVGEKHSDEDELKELTGVELTYTRPGGPLGTIEWASRENMKNGCITGANGDRPPTALGYDTTQARIIEVLRRMERASRHKAELPPELSREELLRAGVVD